MYGCGTDSAGIAADVPGARKGVLDLRQVDLAARPGVFLRGEWEFYWKQFLLKEFPESPDYRPVPEIWKRYKLKGGRPDEEGYATFRLHILTTTRPSQLALLMSSFNQAYRVYVNQVLVDQAGRVGQTPDESSMTSTLRVIPIPTHLMQTGRLELVIQIANFRHPLGGIYENIVLGTLREIERRRRYNNVLQGVILGGILLMGLYHLGLFISRPEDYFTLYFALFCLTITVLILDWSALVFDLYEGTSWWFMKKTNYLMNMSTVPLFALYLHAIFPEDFSRTVLRILLGASVFILGAGFALPVERLSLVISPLLWYIVAGGAYNVFVFLLAAIRRREGAIFFSITALLFFFTILYDVLYNSGMGYHMRLVPLGLFVFIFSQAFLLSRRFAWAFRKVENLSRELIQADQYKDEFLSNLSHELRTPLTSILGYAELLEMHEASGTLGSDLIREYSQEIHKSGKQLESGVDDLMLIAQLETGLTPDIQTFSLVSMLRKVIEDLDEFRELKDFSIKFDLPEGNPRGRGDRDLIARSVRIVLENAIQFAPGTGEIEIRLSESFEGNPGWRVMILDKGPGVAEEQLEKIWDRFYRVDGSHSADIPGVGLGLYIARRILELHGGQTLALNRPGGGLAVILEFPG